MFLDVEDGYNVLKIYLMLFSCEYIDVGYFFDQIIWFWCGWLEVNWGMMICEQMICLVG